MENNKKREDIIDFLNSLDDMSSSKFILGDRKIALTLSALASNQKLVDLFSQAMLHFNFENEYMIAKNKDIYGRDCIVPPKQIIKSVAFTLCLLYHLDSNKIKLKEFLNTFFYDENPNIAWAKFCEQIITPFKQNTEFLYINGMDAHKNKDANFSLKENITSLLQEINVKVSETSSIAIDLKQEIFSLTSGIEDALTPNKLSLVKPLFFGLKNSITLSGNDKILSITKKLYSYLVTCDMM